MTTLDRAVGSPAALPSSVGPLDVLRAWGWDDDRAIEFSPFAESGLWPARVVAQHRGLWLVVGANGEAFASPTGRLRHRADEGGQPTPARREKDRQFGRAVRNASAERMARKRYAG
jgi:hypothetical protein